MHEEDLEIQEEDTESSDVCKQKIAKLRAELETIKKERQEYLDGWQRMRADMVNARKIEEQNSARAYERGLEALFEDVARALDGFAAAMQGPVWGTVDEQWRRGFENIRAQLRASLERHGISVFGAIGEPFDPRMHDAVREIEMGEPGTIAEVYSQGYKKGDRVLRAAQVAVVRAQA